MQYLDLEQSTSQRIAIFLPSWLGDACMATPTLRSIRKGFPQAHITVLGSPVVLDLLRGAWKDTTPWYDDSLAFIKKRRRDARPGDVLTRFELPRALRQRKFELGVLLTNSFWTACAMSLGRVKHIVGYKRDFRGFLLNTALEVPRDGKAYRPIPRDRLLLGAFSSSWLRNRRSPNTALRK